MTAAMKESRKHSENPGPADRPTGAAGVVAPPENRRAPIWDRPVPGAGRAPLVHAGACERYAGTGRGNLDARLRAERDGTAP